MWPGEKSRDEDGLHVVTTFSLKYNWSWGNENHEYCKKNNKCQFHEYNRKASWLLKHKISGQWHSSNFPKPHNMLLPSLTTILKLPVIIYCFINIIILCLLFLLDFSHIIDKLLGIVYFLSSFKKHNKYWAFKTSMKQLEVFLIPC